MNNRRFKAVLAAIVSCTVSIACGGGSGPTGSSEVSAPSAAPAPAPAATAPSPAPAQSPAPEEGCSLAKLKEGLKWTVGDGTVTFRLTNTTGYDCPSDDAGTIWFVNYAMKDGVNQVFFDGPVNVGKLKMDETVERTLKTPCEPWQADLSFSKPVEPPAFSPGYLIGHKFGGADNNSACTPSTECTPSRVDISLSQQEGLAAQSVTASVAILGQSYSFSVNAADGATVIVNFGDGSPAESVTGPFPKTISHSFAFSGTDKEYTVTASVSGGKFCAGKDQVTVNVRKYECRDFPPVPVSVSLGSPDTTLTATTLTVNSIPVTQDAGVSGTFSPALPNGPHNRPAFGQPAGSQKFDYNWSKAYSPADGLQCSVSGKTTTSVPIPPQDQCVPEWVFVSQRHEYGTWGACEESDGEGCEQSRTDVLIIVERNSCTQETRERRVEQPDDTQPCECEGDACDDVPATSAASQGFELANSSEAGEEAWVNANVDPGPYELIRKDDHFDDVSCTTAVGPAKVVLVKAGKKYKYYLNVTTGQQLCTYDNKDISHVSYFNCEEDD